jgi:hypothetical protein
VPPSLSVSPSAGPVGSVVTVHFGPASNGCVTPAFESPGGIGEPLPYVGPLGAPDGVHGADDFVIPSVIESSLPQASVPVSPGTYRFVLACDTTNNPATLSTVSVAFTVTPSLPPSFVGAATTADGNGYWLVQAGGGVFSYGNARFYGSLPGEGIVPTDQVVGLAATPDGKGYWLVSADGGVFSFGDAAFLGSMGGQRIDQPVVGIASTSDGNGYWLVSATGTVYPFGDATLSGQLDQVPNEPIVGIAPSPDGNGYWEVAADGGVFAFGDAPFHGSMGGQPLDQPVVGLAVDVQTGGYWEHRRHAVRARHPVGGRRRGRVRLRRRRVLRQRGLSRRAWRRVQIRRIRRPRGGRRAPPAGRSHRSSA